MNNFEWQVAISPERDSAADEEHLMHVRGVPRTVLEKNQESPRKSIMFQDGDLTSRSVAR